MRGDLDETLARMARREEALRRRAGAPDDEVDVTGPMPAEPPGGHGAYRLRGGNRPVDRDPVEEVAEAVRRVVAEHPGLAVTMRVEHDGHAYPLRVSWAGPDVSVGAEAVAKPPPAWPMSVKTVSAWTPGQDGPGVDPAARLAEMIRRDPSLLEDTGPLP